MRHPRTTILCLVLLVFAASCFGAFFFWKSYQDWRADSPLNSTAHEGFSWATGQYVVELERSRAALVLYAAGQADFSDVKTRLAILRSRGDILVEPSPLANSLNFDRWTRETTGRLSGTASQVFSLGDQLHTKPAAMVAANRLAAIAPLAHELNVRMRLRDNAMVTDMLTAQQNLQIGFGITALLAMVCAVVLAVTTIRQLHTQQRLNEALGQAERYARSSADIERRASASMRRIVAELLTVERSREGRLVVEQSGVDLANFIAATLPGCDVSERLRGARACLDTALMAMALGSLWAMCCARGHYRSMAMRNDLGVVIDITDDGPPLRDTEDLFQPLSAASLAAGDSGVGHAAARIAIECHGGTITYDHDGGRNRYRIVFPLRGCAA